MVLALTHLLLESHAPRRHLPSFPTRRSSDLRWTLGEFAEVSRYEAYADDAFLGAVYADALYVKGFGGIEGRLELVAVGHDGQRSEPAVLDYDLSLGQVDRKSTRLNSSHVAISYAVFCLKKKNDTTA